MHPLINDASNLTEAELENKILKLNKAYFVTHNEETRQQIILALDTYKIALQEKRIAERRKQQENGDNDLDSLINIS
jgi:hypothetical protein